LWTSNGSLQIVTYLGFRWIIQSWRQCLLDVMISCSRGFNGSTDEPSIVGKASQSVAHVVERNLELERKYMGTGVKVECTRFTRYILMYIWIWKDSDCPVQKLSCMSVIVLIVPRSRAIGCPSLSEAQAARLRSKQVLSIACRS